MTDSKDETPDLQPGAPQTGAWNRDYTLESGQTQLHELGHLRLWLTLLDKEWQVRADYHYEQTDPAGWQTSTSHVLPGGDVPLQRFVRPDASTQVRFLPALAKLPTVIRPYQPLTLPADSECIIYVGTQVWMQVRVGERDTLLTELALTEPSLTWVGPSTMEGDLCYTAPSFGRMALDAVPKRPWRAITPVRIRNRRPEPLLLERFSLPTQLLPLFQNEEGQLWAPKVTVVCETDMNAAQLKIAPDPIPEAGHCQRLSPARESSERGGFIRAFDRMFG
ncbi:MAG: hypothetical protein R3175_07625 [Marinobacter sp.]|uniref:hypothetical protein n=1 Tax=Marinobacter sp. TaxID=50741 RepID=UPI00299E29B9|nr:hypothetical protein [Marinobacter sp.]MDX1755908.1 hypothetical protein [Marinobacter sp.]